MARKKAPEIELPPVSVPKAVQPKRKISAPAAHAPAAKAKEPAAETKALVVPKAPAANQRTNSPKAKQMEATNGHSLLNLNHAMNGSVTDEQIAERAYFHWIERGCPFGSPEEDWLYAEQELGLLR
jgi:hypothetical protein